MAITIINSQINNNEKKKQIQKRSESAELLQL